ncbi:MAG: PASTA domain-containing protein [Paludibacteraceae bacterium]|nr:PASTA domain-containing protein [Paludibacteraceae bacterium]MBR6492911.1 PASTA domain-containing protein [Paludibacteraceae bacterium]
MEKRGVFDKSDLKFVGWNVLLAVIVGVLLLVGLIIWLRNYTQHGIEVEVEDVRGMVLMEAEPILNADGLRLIVVDSTYSDKVPFGTIVEQEPKAGSHAKNGRAVYVTINATTKRRITMPDMQDISYRQAEATLRGLGLRVDTVYEYRPSEFRDLVLDVKSDTGSLHPGDKVTVGTRVRLVVGFGRGTEQVTVPNVIGLTLKNARALLLNRRLTVGAVHYDNPQEEQEGLTQYVYSQTPAAGEKLVEGETVMLRLSSDADKVISGGNDNSDDDSWF